MAYQEVVVPDEAPRGNWKKFEKLGDCYVGLYVGSAPATERAGEKPKTDYIFRNKEGTFTLTANYDLNRRMKAALDAGLAVGHLVKVTYQKDAPPFAAGQSPMKVFQVLVDKDWKPARPAAAPAPIAAPRPAAPAPDDIDF